jgi:ribosomal protein S27E
MRGKGDFKAKEMANENDSHKAKEIKNDTNSRSVRTVRCVKCGHDVPTMGISLGGVRCSKCGKMVMITKAP